MPPRKPKPASPSLTRHWWNVAGHIYTLTQSQSGRIQLAIYVSLILLTAGIAGLIDANTWSKVEPVTPDEFKMGWDEATAKAESPRIAAMMPKFAIVDANGDPVSGAGKNAELWKFEKIANGGKHITCYRQETGDCVANGAGRVIACRQAVQIAREGRNEVLKIPDPMYIYGISRVQIGKRQLGRGAGSIGSWAGQGTQAYGVLSRESAESMGYPYSGRLADKWGWEGPPANAIAEARKFRIRTISQINNAADCRDALVNGYPVTVASNRGFTGGTYDRDGKRWLRAGGSWAHQMAILGVEDRPGREKGFWIQNSWGENAHPKPLNDEPLGGFWADWKTVDSMLKQGDSWAFSDFDGFPAAEIDWQTFVDDVAESGDADNKAAVVAADEPEPEPILKETRKMYAFPVSLILLLTGVSLGLGCLFYRSKFCEKYKRGFRTAASILLIVGLLSASITAEAGGRRSARFCRDGSCGVSQQYQGQRVSQQSYQPQGYYRAYAGTNTSGGGNLIAGCGQANCVCGVDCICPPGTVCSPANCVRVNKPVVNPAVKPSPTLKAAPLSVPVSQVASVDKQVNWQTMETPADTIPADPDFPEYAVDSPLDPLTKAVASLEAAYARKTPDILPVDWNAFSELPERTISGQQNPFVENPSWNTMTQVEDLTCLANGEKPVLIMYTAKWCGPCQVAKSHFEASKASLPFTVLEVDVDADKSYRGPIPHFAYQSSRTSTGWGFLSNQPGWNGLEDLKAKWEKRIR